MCVYHVATSWVEKVFCSNDNQMRLFTLTRVNGVLNVTRRFYDESLSNFSVHLLIKHLQKQDAQEVIEHRWILHNNSYLCYVHFGTPSISGR